MVTATALNGIDGRVDVLVLGGNESSGSATSTSNRKPPCNGNRVMLGGFCGCFLLVAYNCYHFGVVKNTMALLVPSSLTTRTISVVTTKESGGEEEGSSIIGISAAEVEGEIRNLKKQMAKMEELESQHQQALERLKADHEKDETRLRSTEEEVKKLRQTIQELQQQKPQQEQPQAKAAEISTQAAAAAAAAASKPNPPPSAGSSNVTTTSTTATATKHSLDPNVKGPIIVVGMPKSGTTSVYAYFTCGGVRTQHYCSGGDLNDHPPCKHGLMSACMLRTMAKRLNPENNKNDEQQHIKLLEECGNYTVYAQLDGERPSRRITRPEDGTFVGRGSLQDDGTLDPWSQMRLFLPQRFLLQELHDDYPDATLVLPTRSPEDWASSVARWGTLYTHFQQEYYAQSNRTKDDIPKGNHQLRHKKEWLSQIYVEHLDYVTNFVKEHPSHSLVTINITDPDAGPIMEDFFGITQTCWGHANRNDRNTTTTTTT